MSMSTIQTENAWQEVSPLADTSLAAALLPQPINPDTIAQFDQSVGYLPFLGKLIIPNAPFQIPQQNYRITFQEFGAVFENDPIDSWPKIRIQFATRLPLGISKAKEFFTHLENHEIKDVRVRPSDDTVDAEVLYTRVMFSLYIAGSFSIEGIGVGRVLGLKFDAPLPSDLQQLLYRAKLYRKLKFIEAKFNRRFILPMHISPDTVRRIDIIFRGITEGEFSVRSSGIAFILSASEIDLNVPPFSSIGEFSHHVGQDVVLFDQHLSTGPVIVTIKKAESASPRLVEQIQQNQNAKVNVRFEVLDSQIIHRFEKYAGLPAKQRVPRLTKFKFDLSRVEPRELVDLIDETLQGDVSLNEAHQIAMGWILYNDLPDRYYPQEPQLDSDAQCWHVPIYLVYANDEGGPVGELVIDVKTGKIIKETPIEELRRKGLALAEQILHA